MKVQNIYFLFLLVAINFCLTQAMFRKKKKSDDSNAYNLGQGSSGISGPHSQQGDHHDPPGKSHSAFRDRYKKDREEQKRKEQEAAEEAKKKKEEEANKKKGQGSSGSGSR